MNTPTRRYPRFAHAVGVFLFLLALLLGGVRHAAAQDEWTALTGSWTTSGDWLSGAVPSPGDDVVFLSESTSYVVTFDDTNYSLGSPLASLTLDAGSGTTTLDQASNNVMAVSGSEIIGNGTTGSTAVYNQSAGTNDVGGSLELGAVASTTGDYNLSSSGTLSANYELIGFNGTGSFTQTAGTTNTVTTGGVLEIGGGNDSSGNVGTGTGTYLLQGGTLVMASEEVSAGGTGTFNQTSGTNTAYYLAIGGSRVEDGMVVPVYTGTGVYNLQGGTLSVPTDEVIGDGSLGYFIQTGGSNTVGGLTIGLDSLGGGSFTLSSTDGPATLSTIPFGYENIGFDGAGTFTQMSGTSNTCSYLFVGGGYDGGIGNVGTGTGTYLLEGGTLSVTSYEYVGNGGTGTFTQKGGTNTASYLEIGSIGFDSDGNPYTGNGTYNLEGGSISISDFQEYVGFGGMGTFNQTGGTNTASYLGIGVLVLDSFNNRYTGTGTYNLGGGTLSATTDESVGDGGMGTFTQTGGSNIVNNNLYVAQSGGTGSYSLASTNGPAMLSATNEYIGFDGIGTLTQMVGTTNTVTINLEVGGGVDSYGNVGNGTGTYLLEGGTLSANYELIGFDGNGSFSQAVGTTNTVTAVLEVGGGFDASGNIGNGTGTYLLQGGTLSISGGGENVGVGGTGIFTQTGGTNTAPFLQVGGTVNSPTVSGNYVGTGIYNLEGGTLSAATDEIVGYGGTGSFYQTGGSNSVTNNLYIAQGGGTASYSLADTDGAATLQANDELIGFDGTGNFTQTLGTTNTASYLYVGGGTDSYGNVGNGTGTYTLAGGTLSAANEVISPTGYFSQGGGTNIVSNDLTVTGGSYLLNNLNPSNGSSTLGAANEYLANGATFYQQGGTNTVAGLLQVGDSSPGREGCTYQLGSGTLSAQTEVVGPNSGGTVGLADEIEQSGGTNTIGSGGSLMINTADYYLSGGILNAPSSAGAFVTQVNGTFSMGGGTENGYLQNFGLFSYTAGTFNGTLENDGTVELSGPFTAGAGIINNDDIAVSSGSSIYGAGAIGLDNEGEIDLANGTIGGTSVLNDDVITGFGTIGGSGGFTNNGIVTQGAGPLALSNTGPNTNNGEIDLAAAQQFRLTAATLTNEGVVNLNTVSVVGTGTLVNDYAGNINGPGTISSAFINNGTLLPGSGQLTVTNAWTNNGLAELTAVTSSIKGGLITNAGTIQGFGTVGSAVANQGIVEAIGGTLDLSGVISNQVGGAIYAGTGDKVLAIQGLSANAGLINLTGGTCDNNSHAMSNTGEISGYGTFRTGGMTTSGSVTLAGGGTTVNGTVTETGGTINTYNPTTFTSAVSLNGGAFTTHETQTVFAGGLNINGGSFNNDPGTVQTTNLTVASGGTLTGGNDSLYQVSGNVSNASTAFQLAAGALELVAPGASNAHTFTWSVNTGVEDIGTLTIDSGQTVDFETGGNSGAALNVLSFQLAAGLTAANLTALQTDISNDLSGDLTINYNPNTSSNSYLDDQTYTFGDGGLLEPEAVPEPSTWALALVGVGLVIGFQRLRRRVQ